MKHKLLTILVFLVEIILSFITMLGIGLFVLPYHATGSHSNLSSDLYSLSEVIIGLLFVAISVILLHRKSQRKWLAIILLGFGLGLVASVVIGNWADIIGLSR